MEPRACARSSGWRHRARNSTRVWHDVLQASTSAGTAERVHGTGWNAYEVSLNHIQGMRGTFVSSVFVRAGAAVLAAALLCAPAFVPARAGADPVLPPSGGVLYVTNAGSGDVSSMAIGQGGARKLIEAPGNPAKTGGDTPRGIALTPNGATAYVVNSGSDQLSVFRVGPQGALLPNPRIFQTGDEPWGATVSPNGRTLYVTNTGDGDDDDSTNGVGTISAYRIGPDGTPSKIGEFKTTADHPKAAVLSPDGRFHYLSYADSAESAAGHHQIRRSRGRHARTRAGRGEGRAGQLRDHDEPGRRPVVRDLERRAGRVGVPGRYRWLADTRARVAGLGAGPGRSQGHTRRAAPVRLRQLRHQRAPRQRSARLHDPRGRLAHADRRLARPHRRHRVGRDHTGRPGHLRQHAGREPGARVRDRNRRHAEAGPRIAVPHRWGTPAQPGARRTPGYRDHPAVETRSGRQAVVVSPSSAAVLPRWAAPPFSPCPARPYQSLDRRTPWSYRC